MTASGSTGIAAVVLDVEGTTTSIAFVTGTLFPYARHHLTDFFGSAAAAPRRAEVIDSLEAEHHHDRERGDDPPAWDPEAGEASAARYAAWLMDRDRKSTPLKAAQGLIWEDAYRTGSVHGHVFGDVAPAFDRWRRRDIEIYIFSSGSVLAQKLLFAHSTSGDLSGAISGYFDTRTGPKNEPASYRAIADAVSLAPASILFVSDRIEELEAAGSAGLRTLASVRPGNPSLPDNHGFETLTGFDSVDPLLL